MFVYKGTKNGWDGNLHYDVGRTYVLKKYDNYTPREFGFNKDIADVNYTYKLDDPDTVVFEIEVSNDTEIICEPCYFGVVVDKFRVIRMLSKEDIERISNKRIQFDQNGKLLVVKHLDGTIEEYRYNEKGTMIYFRKTNRDEEKIRKYNDNGMLIEQYDRRKDTWEFIKYDNEGELTCLKTSWGDSYEVHKEKLENGHILVRTNHGDGKWTEEEYDQRGKPIRLEYTDGSVYEFTYDEKGNLLTYKEDGRVVYQIEIL